jgi:hypothetical protein
VLHDAGQGLDRTWFVDALTDEQRSDEIIDPKVVLGDEITERR